MTNQTPDETRIRILAAVDAALREHYGDNYSMRCVQSSQAIADLLMHCGVPAMPVHGQACVAQVIGGGITWLSFGSAAAKNDDGRWHSWVMTPCELVDLTISQHHLAPGAEPGGVPCPALWLNDGASPPPSHRYLPGDQRGVTSVSFFDPDEDACFRRFLVSAHEHFDGSEVTVLPFEVLSSGDDMERLCREGDPWVNAVSSKAFPPLPLWAQLRAHDLCSDR